ncbi:L-idonate 5-dehydrogenase [Providencia sp. SP181]|uniref:L-idonate 5-dehydrogenase n=1 Tax=Providencia sp. SP181 TaxID=3136277 RepID=UPI003D290823
MNQLHCKACFAHQKQDIRIDERTLEYSEDQVVVKVEAGGICGSDIHYYQEGHAGLSILKHPMVIGHEFSGVVHIAPKNSTLKVGCKVAVNPSQPCNQCQFCLEGKQNVCSNMRFMGSAQFNPHVDGGFSEFVVVSEQQCYPYDPQIDSKIMAFSEPTAVAIHAINVAGSLVGKKVLVIGAGPIGGLIIAAAKASGASEVIASDVSERCREIALQMGANKVLDASNNHDLLAYQEDKGYFDVTFEASGSSIAISASVDMTKRNGIVVQVGMGKNTVEYPVAKMLVKEISWKGSFRFIDEFATAVTWLQNGIIDPRPLISGSYPYQEIEKALLQAADKTVSSKVLVTF